MFCMCLCTSVCHGFPAIICITESQLTWDFVSAPFLKVLRNDLVVGHIDPILAPEMSENGMNWKWRSSIAISIKLHAQSYWEILQKQLVQGPCGLIQAGGTSLIIQNAENVWLLTIIWNSWCYHAIKLYSVLRFSNQCVLYHIPIKTQKPHQFWERIFNFPMNKNIDDETGPIPSALGPIRIMARGSQGPVRK